MNCADLFAGVGELKLALSPNDKIVYTNEWDKYAAKVNEHNFWGKVDQRDIREVSASEIPSHDLLMAAFPCQPFSKAGKLKGRDDERGLLQDEVIRIVDYRRPSYVICENVPQYRYVGTSFQQLQDSFNKLGYGFAAAEINALGFVPQYRRRLFMVAVRGTTIPSHVLEVRGTDTRKPFDILEDNVDDLYTISDEGWAGMQAHAQRHQEKGNKFGYGLVTKDSLYTRTLLSRYYKGGSDIIIEQEGKNPRKLTVLEASRLMGMEDIEFNVSRTQALKQLGNSIVVPVLQRVVDQVINGTSPK